MMTKFSSTRVSAPNLQSDIVNADPTNGNNDAAHQTQIEPCAADGRNKKSDKQYRLLKCKQTLTISTLNVRTIRQNGKLKELAHLFNTYQQSIIGIIDHKLVHTDDAIKTTNLDKCSLITSSAWRNSNGAASGGIGIVISKMIEKSLCDVVSFNERILIAHFDGNPKTTVIVQYSPTEGSSDSEDHYKNLANAINTIPKHNVLFVIGDFNAHLGENDAKYTYHEKTNSNGKLLLDLSLETNLVVSNVIFQKPQKKLWTYISDMNGLKSQVDYILINKKWRKSKKC